MLSRVILSGSQRGRERNVRRVRALQRPFIWAMRILRLVMVAFGATPARSQQGCCCLDTPADAVQKLTAHCEAVRCSRTPQILCSTCGTPDSSEACRFCFQSSQHFCGKASCAPWCAETRQCDRFMACVGCDDCATLPPPPPPAPSNMKLQVCQTWCEAHPTPWSHKCELFAGCHGCVECHQSGATTTTVVGRPRQTHWSTVDLELYFANLGIAARPLLNVSFQPFKSAPQRNIVGSTAVLSIQADEALLAKPPSRVSWVNLPHIAQRQLLVLMDIDAGGRSSVEGERPGPHGPFLSAMWTDCTGGTFETCRTLIPYQPPAHALGTDRYVFLLLQQPTGYLRGVGHVTPFGPWDFEAFLRDNWSNWWKIRATAGGATMCPALAYNFMYVSRTRQEAEDDPKRQPPFVNPPPPRYLPWPPPPPGPPKATWWGGFDTKPVWEQDQ